MDADDGRLEELLEQDPIKSSRDLALELTASHTTVLKRVYALGMVQLVGKWVTHKL